MSVVKFNLFELPHASNVSAAGYFPVVAEQTKVNEDDICAYAEKSTTLTEADIKATFSMLARYLVEHLANGDRIELPGIGSLVLRLGSDEPILNRDDKNLSRSLKVRGISFTPKKELLQAIETDVHFHRVASLHQTIPTLTDEDLVNRLQAYIRSGNESLLTRAAIQAATGYTKSRTLRSLPGWIERGLLIKLGTARAPFYRLAPEYAVEPARTSPESPETSEL